MEKNMVFPYGALWYLPGWAAILDFQNMSRRLSRVSNLGHLDIYDFNLLSESTLPMTSTIVRRIIMNNHHYLI
jgi:hypothetical protein